MSDFRYKIKSIIFGTDTPLGKLFDIILIILIILSVITVLIESVSHIAVQYQVHLITLEIIFTILFTLEYFLRIYCIRRKLRYIISFYGLVDFISIVPLYISYIIPGSQFLSVIRVLRILRVFRVLKLVQYINEADYLIAALIASRRKIFVFLFAVMNIVIILGSIMYLIEGESSGFTSIPRSIYWAIVTLTTVGYGDISPITAIGQSIAAIIMVIGYSIIAVPGGILISELSIKAQSTYKNCHICKKYIIDSSSSFCSNCGTKLK